MKNKKLIVFIALIIGIIILDRVFGWSDRLSDAGYFALLERLTEENLLLAVLIYIAVAIVGIVVLALPGVTFGVIAGALFGPILGTAACLTASTLGAMGSFIVGRYFLKDSIKPRIENNRLLKKWLFDESGRNELFVLMITRLVPVFPYNLQNYAYGITDISFAAYSIGTFIFMIPGTAMFTIGSAGITDSEHRVLYIVIAVIIALIVFGTAAILRKKYLNEEDPSEETLQQDTK